MQYKGDQSIYDAACTAERVPAEAGSFLASNQPLVDYARSGQSQLQINTIGLLPRALFVSASKQPGHDTSSMNQRSDYQGAHNKFPDFFRMGTFIDSTHREL